MFVCWCSDKSWYLEQPTNGIGYLTAVVNARRLPLSLRPYLPLWASYWTQFGTRNRNFREFSHQLELTGELSAGILVAPSHNASEMDKPSELIVIRGKALTRNIPKLYGLMSELISTPGEGAASDLQRFQMLLTQTAADVAQNVGGDSALEYARLDSAAKLQSGGAVMNVYAGLPFVRFANDLAAQTGDRASEKEAETGLRAAAEKLNQISQILFADGLERVLTVGDASALDAMHKPLDSVLAASKSNSSNRSVAASDLLIPTAAAEGDAKSAYPKTIYTSTGTGL